MMADDADGATDEAPAVATTAADRQSLIAARFKSAPSADDTSQAPAPSPAPSPQPPTEERAPALADGEDAEAVETAPDDDALVDEDEDTLDVSGLDPKDVKGHQAVKRAEVRMRQELADERAKMQAEFDRAVASVQPKLVELEKLQAMAKKGRFDLDAAAELFGWTEDDMEAVMHAAAARSPKYKDRPEVKTAASKALQAREERARQDAIAKRQDDLEAELKRRDEQAANQAEHAKWLGGVKKLVDDKAPLTKRLLAKNPEKAEFLLTKTALDLHKSTGKLPSEAAVIRELEKRRAAHRSEFVDDEPEPAATAPAGKKLDPKKSAAKPNGSNGAGKVYASRDEALADFRAGKHLND